MRNIWYVATATLRSSEGVPVHIWHEAILLPDDERTNDVGRANVEANHTTRMLDLVQWWHPAEKCDGTELTISHDWLPPMEDGLPYPM